MSEIHLVVRCRSNQSETQDCKEGGRRLIKSVDQLHQEFLKSNGMLILISDISISSCVIFH